MKEHLFSSLMPFLGSLEGALVAFYDHFWAVDIAFLAGVLAVCRYRSLLKERDGVSRGLLGAGLTLIGMAICVNEWTVATFFSRDASLSSETRILIAAFDVTMVLFGALLVRFRSDLRLFGLMSGKSVPALLPFLGGIICTLVFLFNAESIYHLLHADASTEQEASEAVEFLAGTEAGQLIRIHSESEILARRETLARFVWGGEPFPGASLPDEVESGIQDGRYAGLANLRRIDKLTVDTGFGINSVAYHFIPARTNGQVIIYHQGHFGDFFRGKSVIAAFLDQGYSVVAMAMPLMGMNSQPVVQLDEFGEWKLTSHNQLRFLEMEEGHFLKYFLHPVMVVLNYVLQEYEYDAAHMVGFSGGGWTATVYSAIDPRIQHSYSVAGTMPLFARAGGDWRSDDEHRVADFYRIANYPELYLLASYGDRRLHRQMFNKYDPCCFSGREHRLYRSAVIDRLYRLGKGSFDTYIDDSHREHKLSSRATAEILRSLQTNFSDSR